ncbi:MAG: hypothetical protein R3E08_05625 [Thiotrichaceae bacterium]
MSVNLYRKKYEKYQRIYERMVEECIEMVSKIYSLCKEGFSQHEDCSHDPLSRQQFSFLGLTH